MKRVMKKNIKKEIIPINICGVTYQMIMCPNFDGGEFDASKCIIKIGTKNKKNVFENIVHEVGEAIMVIRDFRFASEVKQPDNGDYRFFLDHREWQIFCRDLSAALKDFLCLKDKIERKNYNI